MKRTKKEKTKMEMSDAEDYLRASLRAIERILQRPKYSNPERDTEEYGIYDCLRGMPEVLKTVLDLMEHEKKEPGAVGVTAEENLEFSVQIIEALMRNPEYANAKPGTEEHAFCECLGWVRAICKIAIELIEAEKEGNKKEKERQEVRKDE